MKKRSVWFVEVPQSLDDLLEDCVKESGYKTKAELIRGAVRERLYMEFKIREQFKKKERDLMRGEERD